MADMVNVTISVDRDIKERAESAFEDIGMSLSTATSLFYRQVLRKGKIPFEIETDPFYSEENQAELRRRIAEIENGTAVLLQHDLIEDYDNE